MYEGNMKAEGKSVEGCARQLPPSMIIEPLLVTPMTVFQLSSLQASLPLVSFSQTIVTPVPVKFKIQIRISPVESVSRSCSGVWSLGSR
jgi:hypothetical protein